MIPTRIGQHVDNSTFVGFLPISKNTLRVVLCSKLVRTYTNRISAISETSYVNGEASSRSLLLFKKDLADLVSKYPGCRLPSYYEAVIVSRSLTFNKSTKVDSKNLNILTNTHGCSLLGSHIPLSTIFPAYSIFTSTVVSNRIQFIRIIEKQHQHVKGSPAKSWIPMIKSFDISF